MNTRRDWEKPIRRLEQLMRLKSFPVAFKMFEDKEKINDIAFMRRMKHKSTLCQLLNLVRNFDWTVGADAEDFISALEDEQLVRDALEQLSEVCRELLSWLYFREPAPDYDEIARRMGKPRGSLGPTRRRCLERMRGFLVSRTGGSPLGG